MSEKEIDIKTLQIDKDDEIGTGGMGAIYGVVGHDNIVAKVIPLDSDFEKTDPNNPMVMDPKNPLTKEALISDILSSKRIQCPFVMRYYGYRIDTTRNRRTGETKRSLVIFMEYCNGGDLAGYLKKYGENGLPQDKLNHLIPQIIIAILYIHSCGIVYSDIKPQNFLLTSEDEFPIVIATDLGVSVVLKDPTKSQLCSRSTARKATKTRNGTTKFTVIGGTYQYNAPEVEDNARVTTAIDIWSLGVLLYEMVTGTSMITVMEAGREVGETIATFRKKYNRRDLPFPSNVDPQLKEMINRCLQVNVENRLTWSELINYQMGGTNYSQMMEVIRKQSHDKQFSDEELKKIKERIEKEDEMRKRCQRLDAIRAEIMAMDIFMSLDPEKMMAFLDRMIGCQQEKNRLRVEIDQLHNELQSPDSKYFVDDKTELNNYIDECLLNAVNEIVKATTRFLLRVNQMIIEYSENIEKGAYENIDSEMERCDTAFASEMGKLEEIKRRIKVLGIGAMALLDVEENVGKLRDTYKRVKEMLENRKKHYKENQENKAAIEKLKQERERMEREMREREEAIKKDSAENMRRMERRIQTQQEASERQEKYLKELLAQEQQINAQQQKALDNQSNEIQKLRQDIAKMRSGGGGGCTLL